MKKTLLSLLRQNATDEAVAIVRMAADVTGNHGNHFLSISSRIRDAWKNIV